ncbi:hypothetical protein BZA77DRAFT_330074 [Pyronema omphalodes]|nr:hypothetical protein BZA77DRAFT_330074 [Pyronema omphalodes]
MCAPLLLSRLTNLRKLSFYGHVGGGYALLLTPLAKEIWEQTPLKSVEVLCWEPQFIDYDYERTYWPTYDGYDYRRWLDPAKIPNNDWNVIAFLRFAPGLKQLDIHSDYFLDRATPHNPPLLQFLTAVEIKAENPEDNVKCLLQLAKCCPVLKAIDMWHWYPSSSPPYKGVALQQALYLVRNSIEEIVITGKIKMDSSATGGLGLFHDFPNLRRIATDIMALVPVSSQSWPGDCSIREMLPPTLESLHLYVYDTIFDVSVIQPVDQGGPHQSAWLRERFRRLLEILQDLMCPTRTSLLTNLRRITIQNELWESEDRRITNEGERLDEICKLLGIKRPRNSSDINDPWYAKQI